MQVSVSSQSPEEVPVDPQGSWSSSVVGLVLQVGDAEKFPQAHGFEGLDPFLRVSKQGPRFTALEEDGGDKRLVELVRSVVIIFHHRF